MFKDYSLKTAFRSSDNLEWLTIFVLAALGLMLTLIYPFLSKAAPASNAGATGVLEICNVASGTGIEDRIFRFQIGSNIYLVPIGGCSAPITLPAGSVTVQELIDGPLTTHGTFAGRFRLLDVSSNVSGAIVNFNLPARTVTANIREGDVTNPTKLTFTNTFAINAIVEICNYPSEPGLSGNFNFTIDALSNTIITVPVGKCSAPVQVNVPKAPGPVVEPAQIKVTQLGRAGFELNTVRTFPSDRFNSLTLRSGIKNTAPNCIKTTNPVEEGCAFGNPGGGYADVDVLEGGLHYMTSVVFSNSFRRQTSSAVSDFDGDGRSDIAVFRPSDRTWYILRSRDGFTAVQFGLSSDKLVPADYDFDGKSDIAVFGPSNGFWYILSSRTGEFSAFHFGLAEDIPVPADYFGDRRVEIAVFRPSDGYWYIYNLADNKFTAFKFGQEGDIPVPADYDGDGKDDISVFREGIWYQQRTTEGFTAVHFGMTGDKPFQSDFDGDLKADLSVFRPSNRNWFFRKTSDGFTASQLAFTAQIVPADYNGDGRADIAVYRDGTWYILGSGVFQFGTIGDIPISNIAVQ